MSDANSTTGDLGFSPTVNWAGPQTNKKRPEFTGETFNALREKGKQERAAVGFAPAGQTPAEQLYSEMWGNRLFNLDAIKFLVRQFAPLIEKTNRLEAQVQELQNQLTLLRGLPPFMKNVEQR
jgi:hypothetical protein